MKHPIKFDGLRNLTFDKTARQSSTSKWSQPDDASRALADDGKWDFAFHTNIEENPWWQVDLRVVYPIYYIVIGNRRNMAQESAVTLTIETSMDGELWQLVHTGLVSWDGDLLWPLAGLVSARFVRLSLKEKTYFHLAKVEIWGLQEEEARAELYEDNLLWMETKPDGLHELQAFLTAPVKPQEITLDLGDFHPIWAFELSTPVDVGFESAKDLKIETSADGHKWWLIHEGLLAWTGSLYYPLQGEIMARFIKISQPGVEQKFYWPLVKVLTRRQPDLQVWALRSDGSGGRLMALLNAMYMAKLLGCDYKFVWHKAVYTAEVANSMILLDDMSELFGANFIKAHQLDNEQPTNVSKLHGARGLCRRHLTMTDWQSKPGIIYSTYRDPIGLYHSRLEPPDFCFKSFFESLPFNPVLQEIIKAIQRVEVPSNFVALHIRSGDIVFGDTRNEILFWQNKAAPLPLIKLALEQLHAKNIPVVLFGRDADALTYFAGLYQASLAVDYLPSSALTPSQRDLLELVLMSRASSIYMCLSSTYSRCASWIGGHIKQVNLYGIASPKEKTTYMKADLEQNAACYHPLQNSFSYLHLYSLNHLTADQAELAFYLDQAQTYDPENEVVKVLRVAECFKHRNEKAGEELLESWLKLNFDLNQRTIEYQSNHFFKIGNGQCLFLYINNYFQPLEAAAKQGYSNAAVFISIMYDLLKNEERAQFYREIALKAEAARLKVNPL